MTDWLILVLLVPAIVVPVVLLLGFAGCDALFGLDPLQYVPEIVEAEATSIDTITLTWTYGGSPPDHFLFERTRLPDPNKPPPSPADPEYLPQTFSAASSPHPDSGRERATTYTYRVQAVFSDGDTSPWSNPVNGTTISYVAILEATQDGNFGNVNTNTVKCEIVPADLIPTSFIPVRMWITLGQRPSAPENITFSKVYVGHKAAAGDSWDAVSLKQVLFGGGPSIDLAPGDTRRSDEIAFAWDGTSALIVSMYFAGGPSSDHLSARTSGSSNSYLKAGADEAAAADATGYTSFPGYLSGVMKIEVAD